jgi:hypothetical protein
MDDEAYRRIEQEKQEAQNAMLQYAAENGDMRLWCWCRRNFDKIVAKSNMPREKMTHGDYIRARRLDRDVLGRRIK